MKLWLADRPIGAAPDGTSSFLALSDKGSTRDDDALFPVRATDEAAAVVVVVVHSSPRSEETLRYNLRPT